MHGCLSHFSTVLIIFFQQTYLQIYYYYIFTISTYMEVTRRFWIFDGIIFDPYYFLGRIPQNEKNNLVFLSSHHFLNWNSI